MCIFFFSHFNREVLMSSNYRFISYRVSWHLNDLSVSEFSILQISHMSPHCILDRFIEAQFTYHPFKLCNAMAFSILRELCIHHHITFIFCPFFKNNSLFPQPSLPKLIIFPSLRPSLIYLLSPQICLLSIFHTTNIQYVHIMFKMIHPPCGRNQYLIDFFG